MLNSIAKIFTVGLLFCAMVFAQSTAQIHGTVRDSTGAAVPAAEVKVTQTDTGVSRIVNTAGDGGFVLPSLTTGPYQVEVTKEGFSKAVQTGIVLQVNSDPLVDISLKVGAHHVSYFLGSVKASARNSAPGKPRGS